MTLAAYKLRDDLNGIFAKAGLKKWNVRGKTWSSPGAMRCAIRCWQQASYAMRELDVPNHWTVLVFSEDGVSEIKATEFMGTNDGRYR